MNRDLQRVQDFLNSNPRKQIRVIDAETNIELTKKLTLEKVLESAENVEIFIQNLKMNNDAINKIKIELFTPNGSTTVKTNEFYTIQWNNDTKELPLREVSSANGGFAQPNPPTEQYQPINHNNMDPNYPNPQMNYPQMAQPFGLGFAQQIELSNKGVENKYLLQLNKSLEDQLKDLRTKYDDDTKALKNKIEDLVSDLRIVKTDLSVAEKHKELELKSLQLEKKPMFDPDTVKTMFEYAPGLVAAIMSKNNAVAGGMMGVENLSQAKQQLVGEIQKGNFSDKDANDLMNLLAVLQNGSVQAKQLLIQAIETFNAQFQ